MSEDRKDIELQKELERLGEAAADDAEIAAAERLAARLEGALHVVSAEGDEVSSLAETLKATGVDRRGDASTSGEAADAATDRALASIFADADASGKESAAEEAPADELEQRRAGALATGVDRMIAGVLPLDAPSDVRELLHVVALIRASAHAATLSSGRLETLVDQAYGVEATAAATQPQKGRGATVLRLALAAVVAVLVLGAGLMVGGYLNPQTDGVAPKQLPAHLTSRSTRDILPGAFPRSQTAGERIDLIYHDRMRSFRELHLGGHSSPPRARRKP